MVLECTGGDVPQPNMIAKDLEGRVVQLGGADDVYVESYLKGSLSLKKGIEMGEAKAFIS